MLAVQALGSSLPKQSRRRWRHGEFLAPQEVLHRLDPLFVAAAIAIDLRAYARVVPGAVGILLPARAVIIEEIDQLGTTLFRRLRRLGSRTGCRIRHQGNANHANRPEHEQPAT